MFSFFGRDFFGRIKTSDNHVLFFGRMSIKTSSLMSRQGTIMFSFFGRMSIKTRDNQVFFFGRMSIKTIDNHVFLLWKDVHKDK